MIDLFEYTMRATIGRLTPPCRVIAPTVSEAVSLANERYGHRGWVVDTWTPYPPKSVEMITSTADLLKAHADIETEDHKPAPIGRDVGVIQNPEEITQYDIDWIDLNTRALREYCNSRGLEVKIVLNRRVRIR